MSDRPSEAEVVLTQVDAHLASLQEKISRLKQIRAQLCHAIDRKLSTSDKIARDAKVLMHAIVTR